MGGWPSFNTYSLSVWDLKVYRLLSLRPNTFPCEVESQFYESDKLQKIYTKTLTWMT